MSSDLRKYARQTNIRLLFGFILILFIVGEALIYWIYGAEAAVLGFVCLLAGLFPLLLIGLMLWGLERVVKRNRDG